MTRSHRVETAKASFAGRASFISLMGLSVGLAVVPRVGQAAPGDPVAVPTFESMGIYWSPAEAAANDEAQVRYRVQGQSAWEAAHPLYYGDRVPARHGGKYRGSIVHLGPGTTYEIELTLARAGTKTAFTARTWSETFPIGETVMLPASSDKKLVITESGTATGYRLYVGPPGAIIDPKGSEDCVSIDASYVILRGLTLKNCQAQGIRLLGGHDIVIEENDISGWGRVAPDGWGINFDSAIFSESAALERVIIQRNKMHHPRSDSNSWSEARPYYQNQDHPYGPHAIAFRNSAGNNVIRYNEVYSDDQHVFNDIFGRDMNESHAKESPEMGFPHRDTDIYGNYITHFHDDAFELEGDNRNVRVWGNYFEKGLNTFAVAPTIVGPIYYWRNVSNGVSRVHKTGRTQWGSELIFYAHNTSGPGVGRTIRIQNPMISLNNILQSSTSQTIEGSQAAGSRVDYDLHNGGVPAGTEAHGRQGRPSYQSFGLDRATMTGNFTLAMGSPGRDQGVVIPNFTGPFEGSAPDMGAHEAGKPPMEFGVNAYRERAPAPDPSAPAVDASAVPELPGDSGTGPPTDGGSERRAAQEEEASASPKVDGSGGVSERRDGGAAPSPTSGNESPSASADASGCGCALGGARREIQGAGASVLLVLAAVALRLCPGRLRRRRGSRLGRRRP